MQSQTLSPNTLNTEPNFGRGGGDCGPHFFETFSLDLSLRVHEKYWKPIGEYSNGQILHQVLTCLHYKPEGLLMLLLSCPKVNLWDSRGIVAPKKVERLPTLLLYKGQLPTCRDIMVGALYMSENPSPG